MQFQRIEVVIVQFDAGFAAVPLGAAPALGADALAGDVFVDDLGKRRAIRRGIGIFQKGSECAAGKISRGGEPAEVGEGGIDVHEFDGAAAGAAGAGAVGEGDDEWDAERLLEECFFAPQAVVAEVKAVIAHENDNRIFPKIEAIERGEGEADIVIGEGDTGEVSREAFGL